MFIFLRTIKKQISGLIHNKVLLLINPNDLKNIVHIRLRNQFISPNQWSHLHFSHRLRIAGH